MQSIADHLIARPWLAALALLLAGAYAARQRHLAWQHRRHAAGARWLTVAAPQDVTAHAAADFWAVMTGVLTGGGWRRLLYGVPHVAWEYTWTGRELTLRVWVPGTVPAASVQAAAVAAWPGTTVRTGPADAPIPAAVHAVGGAHWPQQSDSAPLRTDHDADPLRALLAAGAQVRAGQHACVQVLARPATARRLRRARRTAAGHPPAGDLTGLVLRGLLGLVEVFLPGPSRPAGPGPVRRDPVRDAGQRTTVDKAVRVPHYEIAVRYAVAADRTGPGEPGPQTAERLGTLRHSVAAAAAAYTGPNRLRQLPVPHPVAVLAARRLHRGFLATATELGVLAAVPQDLAVPGLERARAAAVPAPTAVPAGGRGVKVLGRDQVGGHSVGLAAVDARQHVHLVGKTGVGKSTLMLNMILGDIHAGRGTVVIDPRGDLVTDILDRLPAAYADRTAIIDPYQAHQACINPLDDDGDPHLAVDNLVGIFSKVFQQYWGPRMDDTLRTCCLTLMRHANPSLSLVPPLLNDRAFRSRFTHDLTDPEGLLGFWTWYDSMNEAQKAVVIGPVLGRLRILLSRGFVKDVIGTPYSSFRMGDILDGGILLCRLPKGILGDDTARLLGSLIVARTWQAATARATIPEQRRRDATLYIDECHNFLNLPGAIDDMLAEARGFRLGIVLAHQNLAQLPRETAAAVSANARSKIYFNVDPHDARELSRHTTPYVSEHDLAHLDMHTAAARLLVGNRELPAFTLTTHPPSAVVGEATAIRQAVAAAHQSPDTQPALEELARTTARRR
ncbi:energy-coupling factor transporter ATP-binding protein EcfA2 [Allocatelliglobosispora scoriae]|uniref:Energy-coupling factor transporter ATP-binding protein EcfA2 n=1 Tax=Allocatelliglobosispora scoriae TaxID=643052 RepID=A0A841C403_9ACTN|nr:type IV secretion system DNA-binding domain-containing protein [Allocatelliglobosispora scoriae]MBB5874615.1 energy-coupling factor transporter ATP-binding protein EcfA2 [Allocatelliglobosispora scoriae]